MVMPVFLIPSKLRHRVFDSIPAAWLKKPAAAPAPSVKDPAVVTCAADSQPKDWSSV
jgi:hypothetical protein